MEHTCRTCAHRRTESTVGYDGFLTGRVACRCGCPACAWHGQRVRLGDSCPRWKEAKP